MSQLSVRPGDKLTVDGDVLLHIDRIRGDRVQLSVHAPEGVPVEHSGGPEPEQDLQSELGTLMEEIISLLSQADAASSQEMLTRFVSDLFYALAQKRQKEERRQKQAEGIARAKAKGVRFGPAAKPLPSNFPACYEAWQNGEMTAVEAAKICGIPRKAFYNAVHRAQAMKSEPV